MNKTDNLKLLAKTIRLLNSALETSHRGDNPQMILVEALAPLQLHRQRRALQHAKAEAMSNSLGYSPQQIDEAMKLVDDWLARLDSENVVDAYEAWEVVRMHYSPYRLMQHLQKVGQPQ
jgi:hypothetical protein